MTTQLSNKIKYLIATKAVDFANDSFKIILMASGFTLIVTLIMRMQMYQPAN